MTQANKTWVVHHPEEHLVKQFSTTLGISSIAAKILVARNVKTVEQAQQLLTINDEDLHDPFLMHGMHEAVARIEQALDAGEKILVYGDYDADGITSTTVLLNALLDLGGDADFVIPNRFDHGYGPNEQLFLEAHAKGVQLIITVDNGISGIEPIRVAKELGMDVIVTDHHEAGEELPNADVILHPRVPAGHYPFGELAGVGVAFKLAHALYGEIPDHLFEYVAIGTIADLVPLEGENRYLVKQGLKALKRSVNPWVIALCEVAGAKQREISEETVGFYFGPRLNAVGRLGDAAPGVHFLMSEDQMQANTAAKNLNDKNAERKDIVNTITEQAIALIESTPVIKDSLVLVVPGAGWNPGVVGIVASRLVEKYYRPIIILATDEEKGIAKGSARSIEGFHLFAELAKNQELLTHFGGHPMAAGLTMPLEQVDELRMRLHAQAQACLTPEQLTQKIVIDVPVELSEVSVEAIEEIRKLGPFGTNFAKPVFAIENVNVKEMRKIGAKEDHLKLVIEDAYGTIDAIGFGKGALFHELSFDVKTSFVGDLQINEWQGNKKPQFMLSDIRVTEWQLFDIRGDQQIAKHLKNMPLDQVTFIAFNEQTAAHFATVIDQPILHITSEANFAQVGSYLVLLDLPENITLLDTLLRTVPFTRIYAHFYTVSSQYFNGMPNRDHFKWYYGFLKKRPSFPLEQHIAALSQHIGLNIDVIKFMTKVFYELGFVKIEKGLTNVVENAPKIALTEAPSYKLRSEQIELEQKLLYASYKDLKQWLNERVGS